MKCMTVLCGGVCHRTLTPHKSGNKIKGKKKRKRCLCVCIIVYLFCILKAKFIWAFYYLNALSSRRHDVFHICFACAIPQSIHLPRN